MVSDRNPSDQWQLFNGQAWVSTSGDRLVTPLVLTADVQSGPTDMAALVAGLDHDDNKVGATNSGGALITRELGSWIIDYPT